MLHWRIAQKICEIKNILSLFKCIETKIKAIFLKPVSGIILQAAIVMVSACCNFSAAITAPTPTHGYLLISKHAYSRAKG